MQAAVYGDQPKADQFEDLEEEENWPDMDNQCGAAATQQSAQTSKSTGETGEGEGSKAVEISPSDNPPAPQASTSTVDTQSPTTKPTTDPPPQPPQPQQPLAPTEDPPEPQASTSTTDTQDPTEKPEEEKDPVIIAYAKSYQEAGKVWLDIVDESKEQAYKTLFYKLLAIGNPHIPQFSKANRKTVLDCIADKSGKYLSEDDFAVYVSREEVKIAKKQYTFSAEEKVAIKDYYDKAKDLCDAQAAFMQSTCTLADKIKNKKILLDIVKQVQLPAVQVHVRTREEEEKLEGKTYRELFSTSTTPAELQDHTSQRH